MRVLLENALVQLTRASDPYVRSSALRLLVVKESSAAIGELERAVRDDNITVRNDAIELVMNVGGPEAARILAELAAHEDPAVRLPAVMALAERPEGDAEIFLMRALQDEDSVVRRTASQGLQQREQSKVQPPSKPRR